MKKLFLFLAAAALTVSCSSDDDNGGGSSSLTFKANGVQKTMENVIVDEEAEGPDTYLYVTGTVNGTEQIFNMETYQGELGSDSIWGIGFIDNGTAYTDNGINAVVEINSSSRLKGTFSGTMYNWSTEQEITITEGKFDIAH
jgi:hypothetical protein